MDIQIASIQKRMAAATAYAYEHRDAPTTVIRQLDEDPLVRLAGMPDDTVVTDWIEFSFSPEPNQVFVDTASEYAAVLTAYDCQCTPGCGHYLTPRYLERTHRHELQHGKIALDADVRAVKHGVTLSVEENGVLTIEPSTAIVDPGENFTLLKLGAFIMGPYEPSEGDLKLAERIGFNSAYDIGARILAYNARAGRPDIPYPLSVSHTSSGHSALGK
jgi:hypothetical protein